MPSWPQSGIRIPSRPSSARTHVSETLRPLLQSDLMKMVSRMRPEFTSPFCLRRQIFRTQMPQSNTKTGIHYDQIYLRQGTVDSTMTAWVPVGDVRPHQGGLIYLEDSVKSGQRIEDGYSRMGEDKGMPDEERKKAYNANVRNSMTLLMTDGCGSNTARSPGQSDQGGWE